MSTSSEPIGKARNLSKSIRRRSRPPSNPRRQASVYDAVAGRVSTDRFIREKAFIPSTRDTASTSTIALPPEEVLFRGIKAPVLYKDDNIYNQDRNVGPDTELPDSDLLKALHAYSADFYARTTGEDAEMSYQSFDGSALTALGILLEESCKQAIGETGYLALAETDHTHRENQEITESVDELENVLQEEDRQIKRRKLWHSEDESDSSETTTTSSS